jgi:hypothetical protein
MFAYKMWLCPTKFSDGDDQFQDGQTASNDIKLLFIFAGRSGYHHWNHINATFYR